MKMHDSVDDCRRDLRGNKVQEYFDYDAVRFADHRWLGSDISREDYRITSEYLLRFLDVGGNDEVLELGCGPGVWTCMVSARCKHMTAMDISAEMLREARTRASSSNVTFVQGDFDNYGESQTYDKIFSVRVIEYFPDPLMAVRKMYRLTRPGGRVVTITKTWPTWITVRAGLWQMMRRVLSRNREPSLNSLMKRLPISILARMFHDSGYRKVNAYPVVLRTPFFIHGRYPMPCVSGAWQHRYESATLRMCNRVSAGLIGAPSIIRKILSFFSETYLVVAQK